MSSPKPLAILFTFLIVPFLMVPAEAQKPTGDGAVIVDQNLFHPSRSVPAPPAPKSRPVPVAAPAPPPPKFILSGVIIDDGTSLALLQELVLTQNKPVLIARGQEVGSYRLTDVQPDRVTLQSPTNTLTVLLLDPSKPRPAVVSRPGPVPTIQATPAPALVPPVPRGGGDSKEDRGAKTRHGALRRTPDASGVDGQQMGGEGHSSSGGHRAAAGPGHGAGGEAPTPPAPGSSGAPSGASRADGGDDFGQMLRQGIQQFRANPAPQ